MVLFLLYRKHSCQHENIEAFTHELNRAIKVAFETGDSKGELARKACELYKQWLCYYWPEGTYTKETHIALAKGYVDDPRFTAYYDKIAVGAAQFLYEAIAYYYGEE